MKKTRSQLIPLILDSITDGVFTVDGEFRINFFNRSAEEITGFSSEKALGKYCFEVFRANLCQPGCVLKKTIETGKPLADVDVDIVSWDGTTVPISVSTAVLRDEEGRMVGGVVTFRDLSDLEELRKEIERSHSFEDIISKNHGMQEIFRIIPDVATSDVTVLVQGPSGSGKELMVRAIHNLSRRREGPFVKVNCGAIPDTLLESELFGYEKGAFTDAKKSKPGRFALAQGGTIFLDEIGDLSPALQVKLLRVLQEKEFEPLGGTVTKKVDVRVVAATNRDLDQLVRTGSFRNDLYYRLKVMKIDVPALSRRLEDVPLLVNHFIDKFNLKMERHIRGVSDQVMEVLMAHDFPGNIRELENAVEHAFVLCKQDRIELRHLPGDLTGKDRNLPAPKTLGPQGPLQNAEAQAILEALGKHGGNRTKAARELGINRTTLWRKMVLYGVDQKTRTSRK